MSGIYDVTLAAGAVANIGVLGSYLKIRSAPYGLVRVKLDGGESYLLDEGLGLRLPDGKTFRDVSVKNESPTAQTVLIFIGDTHFEDTRITGTVSITNKIGALVQHLELSGGVLLPIAFLATPIILPAVNVKGVTVRTAQVGATAGAGGTSYINIVAAPAVPVSVTPANSYRMAAQAGGAGVAVFDSHVDQNYTIPPGWGIWCCTQHGVSAAAAANYTISCEVL